MQYVFVVYIYDLNAILVRAMPSKTNGAMIAAFGMVHVWVGQKVTPLTL
jgi:hypothetical protein